MDLCIVNLLLGQLFVCTLTYNIYVWVKAMNKGLIFYGQFAGYSTRKSRSQIDQRRVNKSKVIVVEDSQIDFQIINKILSHTCNVVGFSDAEGASKEEME